MISGPKKLFTPRALCVVFCGGFCGTLVRHMLGFWIQSRLGTAWPYDILLLNLTGAFVLAMILTWAEAARWIGPTRRLFLGTGFLGAYTTFSSLASGSVQLLLTGQWLPALFYLCLSLIGGWLAIIAGIFIGRLVLFHKS